jgi:hypothetical protein
MTSRFSKHCLMCGKGREREAADNNPAASHGNKWRFGADVLLQVKAEPRRNRHALKSQYNHRLAPE